MLKTPKVTIITDGASYEIGGGKITTKTIGKHTAHAANHKLTGPASTPLVLPVLPNDDVTWVKVESYYDDTWATPWPLEGLKLKVNQKVVVEKAIVKAIEKKGQ